MTIDTAKKKKKIEKKQKKSEIFRNFTSVASLASEEKEGKNMIVIPEKQVMALVYMFCNWCKKVKLAYGHSVHQQSTFVMMPWCEHINRRMQRLPPLMELPKHHMLAIYFQMSGKCEKYVFIECVCVWETYLRWGGRGKNQIQGAADKCGFIIMFISIHTYDSNSIGCNHFISW